MLCSGEVTHALVDMYVATVPLVFIRPLRSADTALASRLFIDRLWYRTGAELKWMFFGGPSEVSTARSSPIASLPQEIVEIILSYFIYDTPTLIACSLTCYSWYIGSVSHLYHSLTPTTHLTPAGWRRSTKLGPGHSKDLTNWAYCPLSSDLGSGNVIMNLAPNSSADVPCITSLRSPTSRNSG